MNLGIKTMVLFRVTLIEAGMIGITLAGIVVARRTTVERTMLLLMNTSFSSWVQAKLPIAHLWTRSGLPSFAVRTLLKPDFQNKTQFCAISDNRVFLLKP